VKIGIAKSGVVAMFEGDLQVMGIMAFPIHQGIFISGNTAQPYNSGERCVDLHPGEHACSGKYFGDIFASGATRRKNCQ
jgi:hypothetical protein